MRSDRRLARACPPPPRDESWRDEALCTRTDPETFFPPSGTSPAPAKGVCRRCPVRTACLSWAVATNQRHGVWGGFTDTERRGFFIADPSPVAASRTGRGGQR